MSGMVRLEGMDELRRQLADAPDDIRAEARELVRVATEGAASEMAHRYARHVVTGTLHSSVKTSYPESGALIGIAQNTAPHSHLFEFGTKRRKTGKGWLRGRMPPADPEIVVPIARRWRRILFRDLLALLTRKGFQVSEE